MSPTMLRVGSIGVLLGTGVCLVLLLNHRAVRELRAENQALRGRVGELTHLADQAEEWSNSLMRATTAQPLASEPSLELLKLRGQVGSLQRQLEALRQQAHAPAVGDLGSPISGLGLSVEAQRRIRLLRMEGQAEYARLQALLEQLQPLAENHGNLAEVLWTTGLAPDPHSQALMEQRALVAARLSTSEQEQGPQAATVRAELEDLNAQIEERAHGVLLGLQAKAESMRGYLEQLQKEEANPEAQERLAAPQMIEQPVDRADAGKPASIAPTPASAEAVNRAREAMLQKLQELVPDSSAD